MFIILSDVPQKYFFLIFFTLIGFYSLILSIFINIPAIPLVLNILISLTFALYTIFYKLLLDLFTQSIFQCK